MIINCVRCNRAFESALVNNDEALKQLNEHLVRHVERKHPKTFRRVQAQISEAVLALTEYCMLAELSVIPETEEWILDRMETLEDKVMVAVGYDPEEEEEEEDNQVTELVPGTIETIEPDSEPAESDSAAVD